MLKIVTEGTHTSAYIRSHLIKDEFFREKIMKLVCDQLKPMKALREKTLNQLLDIGGDIVDLDVLMDNSIELAIEEDSFLPKYSTECLILTQYIRITKNLWYHENHSIGNLSIEITVQNAVNSSSPKPVISRGLLVILYY